MPEAPNFDEGVASFEDTIKRIEAASAEKQSQETAPVPDAIKPEAAPVVESAPVPDVPVSVAAEAAPQAEVVSPRLRRLLEKEAALIERENKLKALEAKPAAPAAREPSLEEWKRRFRANPVEALKALNPEFKAGALAKQLWYHDLGDLAPKEARAEMEAVNATGSVEALRAELEETKQTLLAEMQQRQNEMAYQQYVGATHSYIKEVPAEMPLVQKFVQKKPDKVVRAILGITDKHYRESGGEVLTPAQAATKLEASLRELQFVEAPGTVSVTPPPATQSVSAGAPNTLRNKHTSVQPTRVDSDELDDEALQRRAMASIEAAKRQREARGY